MHVKCSLISRTANFIRSLVPSSMICESVGCNVHKDAGEAKDTGKGPGIGAGGGEGGQGE